MSDSRLHFPEAVLDRSADEYRAFAVSETFADVTMLDIRLKTGDRIGLPYPWLGRVSFVPPLLTLQFTTGTVVTIRGRHLAELYASVIRHQCVFVREVDRPTGELLPDTNPLIWEISLTG